MNHWQGLYGHSHIKSFLDKLLDSGSFPQVLLFSGPSGVGKDAFAFRFAESAVNSCLNQAGEHHLSFKSMVDKGLIRLAYALPRGKNEEAEDDPLVRLTPKEIENIKEEQRKKIENPYYDMQINSANQLKINSIREIIRILSLNRDFRIQNFVILLDADQMRVEAQNSLLKILEEPPKNTTFILTTSRIEFIAETIRSRSWIINYGILHDEELSSIMTEFYDLKESEYRELLPLAAGSATRLQEIISTVYGDIRESVLEFLRQTMVAKFNSGFKLLEQFSEGDSLKLILMIDLIAIWFRDLTRFRTGNTNLFYSSHISAFEKFDSRFSHIQPAPIHEKLEKFRNILTNTNTNISVVSFNLMFSLADLIYGFSAKNQTA